MIPAKVSSALNRPATSPNLGEAARIPGFVWLDSADNRHPRAKRSLVASKPKIDIQLGGSGVSSLGSDKTICCDSTSSFLEALDRLALDDSLVGYGYIGYEATLPLVYLSPRAQGSSELDRLPSARFLFYDRANCDTFTPVDLSTRLGVESTKLPDRVTDLDIPCRKRYEDAVAAIKAHIAEGDIYQANLTARAMVRNSMHPWETYVRLRRLNPGPYCAYLNFGDYQILSSSPEQMFYRNRDYVTTAPIKGTIAVGRTDEETLENIHRLEGSDKDRAELLMIIDLYRNDLGKVARPGSVQVCDPFRPELFSSVIHLVSDVKARMSREVTTGDIIRALLPAGSITGAPKKRAVEIIQEIEWERRNIYTGCIGYISGQEAEFNVAIRTIMHRDGEYHINAGGGVVADSSPQGEFQEMRLKAYNLLKAVGVTTEDLDKWN